MPGWISRSFNRLMSAIDRVQGRRPWTAVPVAAAKKFGEDKAGNLAGLIAYYGFFSLFPLLLVLVTVLGFVLSGNEDMQRDVLDSALAQFPVVGDQLRESTGKLDTSGFAFAAGALSALWAGTGVVQAAQDAMHEVWDIPFRRRPNFFVTIVRSFGLLVVIGAGIVLTAGLTGAVGAVGTNLPTKVAGIVLGAVLNVAIFLLAFRVLTIAETSLRDLLPGAVVAGLAWMALQLTGGYLLNHQVKEASQTYGAFAVVIGMLWWLYLQAQVLLFAAELNVVLTRRLWPRSLTGHDRETDRRALRRHAKVEERVPDEHVEATFEEPAEGRPDPSPRDG
jgi:YihY family inner membrane protein